MYTRRLSLPEGSFFLFGPRATGKTTWLRQQLPGASSWHNLLLDSDLSALARSPAQLLLEAEALELGGWVVIDEIQKLPQLLDIVQEALSRRTTRARFALTGSSARKLRRGQANLLAGRAVTRRFFPLVAAEFGLERSVDDLLGFGCLPLVLSAPKDGTRIDLLQSYADTYLAEEIRAEALVKNLVTFTRFLEIAALMNGQVTNVSAIARDAGVARPTVQGYFDVLVDTLLASWLPAFRARARVKEVAHPKFFFFDTGVVRALSGRLREPIEQAERGHLLETYLLHELRAYINDANCGGELSYWRTPAGFEVDFVWSRGARHVAVEVKASERWRSEEGRALRELTGSLGKMRAIAVYLGARALRDGEIEVWPLSVFLERLNRGDVIG